MLTASATFAGQTTVSGNISGIKQKGKQTVITITGTFNDVPCSYGTGMMIYWVDNTTEAGRALISAAIGAGDWSVIVTGDGVCTPTWVYGAAKAQGLVDIRTHAAK